ncbi:MAG: glycosyltransferase family 4 protein [Candidatus Beckwithbacteria bacterium]
MFEEDNNLEVELYKAHCLVIPSFKEGHPLILFEAWAHKLPVIATKVGSVPKFVNQDNGYLISPNDQDSLIRTMKLAYKTLLYLSWVKMATNLLPPTILGKKQSKTTIRLYQPSR